MQAMLKRQLMSFHIQDICLVQLRGCWCASSRCSRCWSKLGDFCVAYRFYRKKLPPATRNTKLQKAGAAVDTEPPIHDVRCSSSYDSYRSFYYVYFSFRQS